MSRNGSRWLLLTLVLLLVAAIQGLGAASSKAAEDTTTGAFSASETITRDNLVNGSDDVVDTRTVGLKVDQTQNLQGRQEISVSWTGAHPTGGLVANQNSVDAQQEEYPMVLLECRGVDSASAPPQVQLSQQTCFTQDWSERYQDSFGNPFPPYRLDRYATEADRAQVVGAPNPLPSGCFPAPTQYWVPFVTAAGTVYSEGPAGCAGEPPESDNVGGSAIPSNETFGVTGLDGDGSAKFDVFTATENASLGCSPTVACALVAVPIMGVSCDPAAASLPAADQPPASDEAADAAECEQTGAFAPGQIVNPQGDEDLSVSGSLWWSASNWRNRITVPLTFAPAADACSVVSSSNDVEIFGSELLAAATEQWEPHFCLNPKSFSFTHVQTGEPEARNLLATRSAEAVFTSDVPSDGYGRPVVNAPVAVSGFAISYVIDGANGQPITSLKLTPRLLAKLLTESYPAVLPVQQEDPALAKNPLNISLDPEFQALNPGITKGVDASEAAAALLNLSGDSDVMQALTTYINADPTARAWLNGKPDQWGMVVNPAYKDISLPVSQWPLLSTFEPTAYYKQDLNDCLFHSPVPYLPLVAAPLATLADISLAMQFADAQSTTQCSQIDGTALGEKLVPLGAQTIGHRFMIGITSLADSDRYELGAAELQTTPGTFVGPDNSTLQRAVSFLKPDTTDDSWPVPYPTFVSSVAANGAYPGTMVVYASVPTSGLSAVDASDYAQLLSFVAGPGQVSGLDIGQLPPGYLPLTAANGLGALAAYTAGAAAAVAAQKGLVPPLISAVVSTGTLAVPPATTTTSTGSKTTPTVVPQGVASAGSAEAVPPPEIASTPSGGIIESLLRAASAIFGSPNLRFLESSLVLLVTLGLALLAGASATVTYAIGRWRGRW